MPALSLKDSSAKSSAMSRINLLAISGHLTHQRRGAQRAKPPQLLTREHQIKDIGCGCHLTYLLSGDKSRVCNSPDGLEQKAARFVVVEQRLIPNIEHTHTNNPQNLP
jgi:hypothetical protein